MQQTTTPRPRRSRPDQAERQRERRTRMTELVFPTVHDLERFMDLAEGEGYAHNFNGWLLLKLAAVAGGQVYPAGYVDGLRADLQKTREAMERARDDYAEERDARKKAERQRDKALLVMHELPDGAELAARILREAQGAGVL